MSQLSRPIADLTSSDLTGYGSPAPTAGNLYTALDNDPFDDAIGVDIPFAVPTAAYAGSGAFESSRGFRMAAVARPGPGTGTMLVRLKNEGGFSAGTLWLRLYVGTTLVKQWTPSITGTAFGNYSLPLTQAEIQSGGADWSNIMLEFYVMSSATPARCCGLLLTLPDPAKSSGIQIISA